MFLSLEWMFLTTCIILIITENMACEEALFIYGPWFWDRGVDTKPWMFSITSSSTLSNKTWREAETYTSLHQWNVDTI